MRQQTRKRKQDLAELEARRLRAAELFEAGAASTAVARDLGVSVSAASQWKRKWRTGGVTALRSSGPRGRRSRLTSEQLNQLQEELLRGPAAHGYATDLWTCPRVGAVIRRLFGVGYADCHVWKLLQKMGWTCQRPARKAKERNEPAIAEWVARDWPRIKRGL